MTAPTVVQAKTGGPGTSATTWSYTFDAATIADGDVVLQVFGQLGGQAYTLDARLTEVTAWPDGLGSPYTNGTATLQAVAAVGAVSTADEASRQFSTVFGAAQTGGVVGVLLRNTTVAKVIEALARARRTLTTANQSLDPPAVVPASDDALLLTFVIARALTSGVIPGDVTPPAGFTEVADFHNTGASQINGVIEVARKALSGQIGVSQDPAAATITNDTARNITISLAVGPGIRGGSMGALSGGGGFAGWAGTKATGRSFTLSGGGDFHVNHTGAGGADFEETFDSTVFNATIDNTNTGFDAAVITGGATIKADTGAGVALHGNSALFTNPVGSTASLSRTITGWLTGAKQWRWGMRRSAKPTGAALTHFRLRNGGTLLMQVSETTTGLLRITGGAAGTVVQGTSAVVTTDSEYVRIELEVDRTAQTLRLDLYYGANLNGNTPDQTFTGTFVDSGTTLELRVGPSTALTNAITSRIDEFKEVSSGLPVGGFTSEAHSGSFALSGGGAYNVVAKKGGQGSFVLSGGESSATVFTGQETSHGNGEVFYDSVGSGTGTKMAQSAPLNLSGGGGFAGWAGTKYESGRSGSFALSGGGDFDTLDDGAKQGYANFGALSAGGRFTGWTGRKGVSKNFGALSGGGQYTATGFHSESTTTSINLSGGGKFAVTGKPAHTGVIALSGGGAYGVVGKAGKTGQFADHNGGDFHSWTGVATPLVSNNRFGSFALSGGGRFAITHVQLHTPTVRLIWTGSIDDHVRTDHPLWGRARLPATQTALLLWRDGRVVEATTLYSLEADDAEYVVAGGHVSEFPVDAWQVDVLADAGYTLVLTATEASV